MTEAEYKMKYVAAVMREEKNRNDWRRFAGRLRGLGVRCTECGPGSESGRCGREDAKEEGCPGREDAKEEGCPGWEGAKEEGCPGWEGAKEEGCPGREGAKEEGCPGWEGLVITDDEQTAEYCAQNGIACIGYCPPEAGSFYFPHVQTVWESFDGAQPLDLERIFCRFHGLPVLIARTKRLYLRESLPGDFEALRQMEQDAGWSSDVTESREKYLAYLRFVYPFYGYGYWTAVLADTEEIVGWCGFAAWGLQEARPEYVYMKLESAVCQPESPGLELGYLVDAAHRRQGLALEMCRAALAYAFGTLEAGSVWVQIPRKNRASLQLAGKLGFREIVL